MKTKSTIIICGDICPTNDTEHLFKENNITGLFNDSLPILEQADVLIANMEFVLTDDNIGINKIGPILKAYTSYISIFKEIGFTALGLANNHIKDCGEEGVISTLNTCADNGILTVGAGENTKKAKKPLIIFKNGWKIGVMAFAEHEFNASSKGSAGANLLDIYYDFDAMESFKAEVDFLVVLFHGGIEYYSYPSPLLQKKCRKMVESGVDLVLCQHSHCIGTQEKYQNGTILYGQGNTLFGYRENSDTWNEGLLVKITLSEKQDSEIQYIPIATTQNGISLMSPDDSKSLLESFFVKSEDLDNYDFLIQKWIDFCEINKAHYLPLLLGLGRYVNFVNRKMNNKIVYFFFSKKRKNIIHNLIRCESHNEVVQTILNEYSYTNDK